MPSQFTDSELQRIIQAYPNHPNAELMKMFGVKQSWLEKLATNYSLKKAYKQYPDIEIGSKCGNIEVLEKTLKKQKNNIMYRCRCLLCQQEFLVRSVVLRGKAIQACAVCSRKDKIGINHHRRGGFGPIGASVWARFTSHAHERGLDFAITVEYGVQLFEEQKGKCALSGMDIHFPTEFKKTSTGNASLDRIDITKGYVTGNVRWVHKHINMMRGVHEDEYFYQLCKAVVGNTESAIKQTAA